MKLMTPVFFVHIPKTAGTSFRIGAEEYFGSDAICYDYGRKATQTSAETLEHIYRTGDLWSFYHALMDKEISLLSGHVNMSKYIASLGVRNTLTFVREPLQRIASQYKHFQRHYDFTGSFEEYYRKPRVVNLQSKMLAGMSFEAIGVIGLTERYSESIGLFNQYCGTEIPVLSLNIGKQNVEEKHEFTSVQLEELHVLNRIDILFYERCVELFESRLLMAEKELPYVHGAIQQCAPGHVTGWAWFAASDDPVEIMVSLNGEEVGVTAAVDLRPGMLRFNLPRGGYVGFRMPFNARKGDRVECRVTKTDQMLGSVEVPEVSE